MKLSCGWCAYLSEPLTKVDALYRAWQARESPVGSVLYLEGVPHIFRGKGFLEPSLAVLRASADTVVLGEIRKPPNGGDLHSGE